MLADIGIAKNETMGNIVIAAILTAYGEIKKGSRINTLLIVKIATRLNRNNIKCRKNCTKKYVVTFMILDVFYQTHLLIVDY